ncbi:hypothetical protein OESDEN_23636 [Oesophagostomum dentatum]|uniref:Uncharacterized protein n=1 Tax=Oesophagostomum dentatum TaxID=61180 RepID=A0A0B1RVM6_OESDE|nr:hypothetical protein OESDEN_23636 [Oesophagostomum dentatum]
MRHVSELSSYVDDYMYEPVPYSRSEFLLYNVSDEYTKNGSIVDQTGVIENQSSMIVTRSLPKRKTEYVLDDILTEADGSSITITFMKQSPRRELYSAELTFVPTTLETPIILPAPTHPVYITEKSIMME